MADMVASDDGQVDVDVIASGVRVGADLMRRVDQLLCIVAPYARQADLEIRGNAKSTFRARASSDRGFAKAVALVVYKTFTDMVFPLVATILFIAIFILHGVVSGVQAFLYRDT
jgi:hypothetical protein